MSRSIATACACLIVPALLAACGSDSPTETPPGANAVNVADNSFNPATLNTSPGATVTWTWVGSELHNVTWIAADLPNSGNQTSGTHQVTMPAATGDYNYQCTLHEGMAGTVRVE